MILRLYSLKSREIMVMLNKISSGTLKMYDHWIYSLEDISVCRIRNEGVEFYLESLKLNIIDCYGENLIADYSSIFLIPGSLFSNHFP